jgi:hypothetical protein
MNKINYLELKTTQLDILIEKEEAMPVPDETEISYLKKQKLRIKDDLTKLRGEV